MTSGKRLRSLGDERGQSLVLALLVMTTLAIVLSTVLIFTASNQRNSNYQKSAQLATATAEAGINDGISVLANPANSCCLEVPWGTGTNAVLPDNSASHPAYQTTYSGGTSSSGCNSTAPCVQWWGTLDQSTEVWTLRAQATVPNPTGPSGSPIVKNMTAQVQVNAPKPTNIQVGVWNTIYSPFGPSAGCDTTVAQSENISVPLYVGGNLCVGNGATVNAPVYVGGFLNFSNKQAQIGCATANGNGCQTPAPVHSAHVGSYCVVGTGNQVNPCKSEPVNGNNHTNIWVQGAPTNLTGPASDFVGITAPQICWGPGTCPGDPVGGWYSAASPGPLHPCTTSAGTPPVFDNNQTYGPLENPAKSGGSVATSFNLTPDSSDYTCKTAQGELSWNHTTRVLTVNGTIFIDGSVYASSSSQTPVTYTGWGSCTDTVPCDGVIYVTGTAYINGVKICAVVTAGNCDWTNWDPNAKMLAFLAHDQADQTGVSSGQGVVVGPSQTSFQGALYANYQVVTGQSAATQGPLVSGTQTVVSGQSFQGSFPAINILPLSIQGPPQAFYINSPMNFCYSTGYGPNCNSTGT
jgi:Tfp pilus assembly protein PilX